MKSRWIFTLEDGTDLGSIEVESESVPSPIDAVQASFRGRTILGCVLGVQWDVDADRRAVPIVTVEVTAGWRD